MEKTLRSAIEHKDLFQVLNCIEDQTEILSKVWNGANRKDVENTLRLSIQEVESIKSDDPTLEMNIAYHLGRLDGFTAAYEEAYRAERQLDAAAEELSQHSAKSMQILRCLHERGTMCHGELAEAVNSSYSALTNIMKKVLLSGAVRSARSGKNTLYYLTETGKRCCERRPKEEYEELERIIEKVLKKLKEESLAEENVIPEQGISVGEQVFLIRNEEDPQPVKIDLIGTFFGQKFMHFTSTNQEKNVLEEAGISKMLYNKKVEKLLQNARETA